MNEEENNLVYPEQMEPKKTKLFAVVFVFVLVIVTISLAFFVWYFFLQQSEEQMTEQDMFLSTLTEQKRVELEQRGREVASLYGSEGAPVSGQGTGANYGLSEGSGGASLSGMLFFSAKHADAQSNQLYIYSLDLSDENAEPVQFEMGLFSGRMIEFTDPNDPSDYYLNAFTQESSVDDPDGYGIHYHDSASGETVYVEGVAGLSERVLEWSETAGLLAFNSINESANDPLTDRLRVINWQVQVVDPQSPENPRIIEGAHNPKWSPDGSTLLYMRENGLYAFNIASSSETHVMGVPDGSQIIATTRFDVSSDGKYLVWTTAKAGLITMFEIDSWEPVVLTELGRIQLEGTEFYWPQFSPDGNYYAVQTIDSLQDPTLGRTNARFEVRPTLGREVVRSYTIGGFDFNSFFTDDWTVAPQ